MTENFDEKLKSILEIFMKAEEKAKKELVKIVKNSITSRIEKSERTTLEKIIDLGIMLAPKIFPKSNLAEELAQTSIDTREKEEMSLFQAYNQIEGGIDQLNSSVLYQILKRLKRSVPLRKIFGDIPPAKAVRWTPVPIRKNGVQN